MAARSPRKYPEETKQQAIRRVLQDHERVESVSNSLNIPASTLRGWLRGLKAGINIASQEAKIQRDAPPSDKMSNPQEIDGNDDSPEAITTSVTVQNQEPLSSRSPLLANFIEQLPGLKIKDFLHYLAPRIWPNKDALEIPCPLWIGDIYAVAACLLEKSGAYCELGESIQLVNSSEYRYKFQYEDLTNYTNHTRDVGLHYRLLFGNYLISRYTRNDSDKQADREFANKNKPMDEVYLTDLITAPDHDEDQADLNKSIGSSIQSIEDAWQAIVKVKDLPVSLLGMNLLKSHLSKLWDDYCEKMTGEKTGEEKDRLKEDYQLAKDEMLAEEDASAGTRVTILQANRALFLLVAYADEALAGAGRIPFSDWVGEFSFGNNRIYDLYEFRIFVNKLLFPGSQERILDQDIDKHKDSNAGSSLCYLIHPSHVRVLPKSQTPPSGLSLRSLTHHISLCPPVGIRGNWRDVQRNIDIPDEQKQYFNLLLIPWPHIIHPKQFKATADPGPYPNNTVPDGIGWFTYNPKEDLHEDLVSHLGRLLKEVKSSVGLPDMIVFPELSITNKQRNVLLEYLRNNYPKISVIWGIAEFDTKEDPCIDTNYEPPEHLNQDPVFFGSNFVEVLLYDLNKDMRFEDDDYDQSPYFGFVQKKHHRWKLEKNQITRYGLSTQLDPNKNWWEKISVGDRAINFFRLREWLTSTIMICEDLARTDPVGRYVRAVAPDLVIALLMDGPQLKERWSAYHATVLADDPGSAVLTLTNLGMIDLSRKKEALHEKPPRTIALWRDPYTGVTEITLPPDATAALLTIARNNDVEYTADGRDNQCVNHQERIGSPMFGGLHFLKG